MNVVYNNTLSVEDYCFLRESVGFYPISVDIVQQALDRSDFIVAARIDGAPAGMARLITDGAQALIMDVAVHPDYQGRGIGRGLMERITQFLTTQYDQMLVNLLTDPKNIAFYDKLGYTGETGMRLWHGITK